MWIGVVIDPGMVRSGACNESGKGAWRCWCLYAECIAAFVLCGLPLVDEGRCADVGVLEPRAIVWAHLVLYLATG